MRATGSSEALIERVCQAVGERLESGSHPLDLAADVIADTFPVAKAARASGTTTVIAFLGQSGVGKTTTIAKLAARMVRAGRRIALATVDAYRVGAVEQLRAYATLFQVPTYTLRQASQLTDELADAPLYDVVLLDTSGALERDCGQLTALAGSLGAAQRMQPYIVTSAVSSRAAMAEVTRVCRPLDPAGCVITKLDETTTPAPVLEHALAECLPIAFLCDGPDLAQHFHRPDGEHFADLLLRGRLA